MVYRLHEGGYGDALLLDKEQTLASSQIAGFSIPVKQLFDLGD